MGLNLDYRNQSSRTNLCAARGPNDLGAVFREAQERRKKTEKRIRKIGRSAILEMMDGGSDKELRNLRERLDLNSAYANLKGPRRKLFAPRISHY